MVETQNEGMGNLPQQPGEIYTIFTVDPGDRKYYLTAVDSSDDVVVLQEKTEGSRVFDDLQLWYMVTVADEQLQTQQQHKQRPPSLPPPPPQGQHQQQQKPFILRNKKRKCALVVASKPPTAGDKQGTKPEQIVPGAGSSSRTQPQIGERRRTPGTGSKSAGKQPARRDGPLQVVLGKHDAEGERWTTEGTTPSTAFVVAGDGNEDRKLSRTCYIQRASNANLVFKVVNTGGRDGSIIELTDKPNPSTDQDQLFCCWMIVPVAGDHIIPDKGASLSTQPRLETTGYTWMICRIPCQPFAISKQKIKCANAMAEPKVFLSSAPPRSRAPTFRVVRPTVATSHGGAPPRGPRLPSGAFAAASSSSHRVSFPRPKMQPRFHPRFQAGIVGAGASSSHAGQSKDVWIHLWIDNVNSTYHGQKVTECETKVEYQRLKEHENAILDERRRRGP